MWRFSLFCFLFARLVFLTSCQRKCRHFKFTGLTDNLFLVKENTEASLTFEVRNGDCSSPDNVIVKVSQKSINDGRYRVFCQIFPGDASPCPNITKSGPYQYQLKKTFDRRDNVTWLWSAFSGSEDAGENAEIDFIVLYPPNVTSLHVNSEEVQSTYTADHNTSVDIVCIWENGNPPVTARLLDRHGVEMEGSIYSSGQINYTFPAVGCQDAGLIRCEAPGASHNQTATLLVRYRPVFYNAIKWEWDGEAGQNITMTFPFKSHTTNFTNCTLRKVDTPREKKLFTDRVSSTPKHCASFADVTGTPPDLVLTVRLKEATPYNEGQWRLTLTNDAGTGNLDFHLNGTTQSLFGEDSEFQTTIENPESNDGSRVPFLIDDKKIAWIISGSVGGLVLIIAATVAMTLLCVRKCGIAAMHSSLNQLTGQPFIVRPHAVVGNGTVSTRSSQASRQSVHLYFEVQDSDVQSIGEDQPPPLHRPHLPGGQGRETTSRDETEEERAPRNTAHFYENTHMMSLGASGGFGSQLQEETMELSEVPLPLPAALSASVVGESSVCNLPTNPEGSGESGMSVSNTNLACSGQPPDDPDNGSLCAELIEFWGDEEPVVEAGMEDEYVRYSPRLYENTRP